VLVVMASARYMTHEMKNLQELKEEAGEASNDAGEKFIFHAVERARYMLSQSVIGGESNLL